ncbi:MAG TPA: hypothetical protein VKF41_02125 [Bryobacteraceae bacterium]|nr:hypothetical protein [Bryobacteraceae bacterium]
MRWRLGLMLLVCAGAVGQTNDAPEVTRAKEEAGKVRALVEAGAAPRAQLEKAEEALADAQDAAILRRTLYGQDLTEEQTGEMMAAASRRFDRRRKALDEAKRLVEAGAASQLSLGGSLEELDGARKEADLAEGRASLVRELTEMAKAEEALAVKLAEEPAEAPKIADRYDGDGIFTAGTLARVEMEFAKRFGKPLPVSAMGETAVHRALGFDHRGRVDVAVHPDLPEGVWLREFLTENRIPYFAFRQAVPGKATGAHIHIGPMSTRLAPGG